MGHLTRFVFMDKGASAAGFCPMCRKAVTTDWPSKQHRQRWEKHKLCAPCQDVICDMMGGSLNGLEVELRNATDQEDNRAGVEDPSVGPRNQ